MENLSVEMERLQEIAAGVERSRVWGSSTGAEVSVLVETRRTRKRDREYPTGSAL
jgi:hypothetical protein